MQATVSGGHFLKKEIMQSAPSVHFSVGLLPSYERNHEYRPTSELDLSQVRV